MTTLEYASVRLSAIRGQLRLVPLLLSLLAFPFVFAGWTGGVAVVAYRGALAATRTGYADVRDRHARAG